MEFCNLLAPRQKRCETGLSSAYPIVTTGVVQHRVEGHGLHEVEGKVHGVGQLRLIQGLLLHTGYRGERLCVIIQQARQRATPDVRLRGRRYWRGGPRRLLFLHRDFTEEGPDDFGGVGSVLRDVLFGRPYLVRCLQSFNLA